jgi:hypothetical protein
MLAALPLVAVSPPLVEAAHPDADLIENAAAFITFHRHEEERSSHLRGKRKSEWTPDDQAAWDASFACNTDWFQAMEGISLAEPTTREGLIAQAEVVLFYHLYDAADSEGLLAWNLAESVLRVLGHPMPAWACVCGEAKACRVEQCERAT